MELAGIPDPQPPTVPVLASSLPLANPNRTDEELLVFAEAQDVFDTTHPTGIFGLDPEKWVVKIATTTDKPIIEGSSHYSPIQLEPIYKWL